MPYTSRRRFLQTATAAALAAPLVSAAEPVMGMIFPPANNPVPPEATQLYPSGVTFLAEGLDFKGMTIESYDEAVPRIVPAALKLKERGRDGDFDHGNFAHVLQRRGIQPGTDRPGA